MKLLIPCILSFLFYSEVFGQCNTTLNKLLPEKALNNDDRFGSALAANDQYMVVAAPSSDTLGALNGGAVFLYEKMSEGWTYRAMLIPSDPEAWSAFGLDVDIDSAGNTVVVIGSDDTYQRIYIFERPASGWETMTETVRIAAPDISYSNTSVSLSEDGTRIVVGFPWAAEPKFAVYGKPATGWTSTVVPEVFFKPDPGQYDDAAFAIDVLIRGDYLYASMDNDAEENGIYVYKWNGSSYQYLAKLSIDAPRGASGFFGYHLSAKADMVAVTGYLSIFEGDRGIKIYLYKKEGEWADAKPTAVFEIPEAVSSLRFNYPIELISGREMVASFIGKVGEWYSGRVFYLKAVDEEWTDFSTSVIFQEDGLSSRSSFTSALVWNGSAVIRSVSRRPVGFAWRDAAVSLTRNGDVWGDPQYITLSRSNGADFRFGSAVHKSGNTLFATAPYDGASGRGAGAVYVYERSADVYDKVHKILPGRRTERSTGGTDAGFGYSITSYGDELAISATSYLYAPEKYGKIFLYRRTGTSWSSAVLYDSLSPPPELMLNHFGTAIAMNDHLLFASAYNLRYGSQSNAVAIYEKINDKWEFQDVITSLGRPFDKSWPSVKLSLHGDVLLAGAYRTLGGGSFIIEKDPLTRRWTVTASFRVEGITTYASDVKLLENHFFVGVSAFANQAVPNSGVVLVHAKLPGQPWEGNMQPLDTIAPNIPVSDAFFGFSLDVVGNTLVVGAPGGSRIQNGETRNTVGSTYIFQTEDYFWKNTTQFLRLQGERYASDEVDYFGYDVGVDEETFYIGSPNENTEAGPFSGAVYYIPTPPLIFLVPPVCQGAIVQLHGYPFDGTWSGPGIADPSGKFDPTVAGYGVTMVTYETVNCAYKGTVLIEVHEGPSVSRVSQEETTICPEDEVVLKLTDDPESTYSWFYKGEGDSFAYIGTAGPEKSVSDPGQYLAKVFNEACSVESPKFTVKVESVDVLVGPHPVVCDHDEKIPLKASLMPGTWEGEGIEDNHFNASGLSNGDYVLTYAFTSPLGCVLTERDTIEVMVIDPPSLQVLEGDFCEVGSATIQATPVDPSLTFTWYFAETLAAQMTAVPNSIGHIATVSEVGFYNLSASNGNCYATSDTIEVEFDPYLPFKMFPEEDADLNVCKEDQYIISVASRDGTNFSWQYKPDESANFAVVRTGADTSLVINESGYYKVSGEYGFCSFESTPVLISFKKDTLFVPNVFSPNGDDFNQVFKVHTNAEAVQLLIFNRYGKQLFISEDGVWEGRDAPSGIYYWHVNYAGCDRKPLQRKGWVNLIR